MSNKSHLLALIKKNLLVYKNNIILTLIELFFPILAIFLFWRFRKLFKIEKLKIENDEEYYYNEGILIQGDKYYPEYDLLYNTYYNSWRNKSKIIAIIGKDFPEDFLDEEIKDLYSYFSSVEELNEYIKSPEYAKTLKEVCYGISILHEENEYSINLNFFASPYHSYIPQVPSTSIAGLDPFGAQPDFHSFHIYAYQGFLFTLKKIYDKILQIETKNPYADITFRVSPQKFDVYLDDSFGYYLNYILGFFMIIAYSLPLSINIYRIVKEKESKIKEFMKIMGLKESVYFFSYFIIYFFFNLIYSVCNTFILKNALTYIEELYIFLFLFLFGLVIFSLIFFFQSFLEKTRSAIITSLLVYSMTYFFSFCVNSSETPRLIKYLVSILIPTITLQFGINTFSNFEVNFNKFNGRVFMRFQKFSVFDMYILFIINFILYMFMGFYLQNILYHDFGLNKKWYFLCMKSYWGSFRNKNNDNHKSFSNFKVYKGMQINILGNNTQDFSKIIISNSNNDNQDGMNQIKNKNIYINYNIQPKNEINCNNKEKSLDILSEHTNFGLNKKYESKDILKIENIYKVFGDKLALNGLSLNIYRNEIFVLLGHNGAGKSTLMNILTGFIPATSGSVIYNSYNILTPEGLDKFRKVVGICPQHDLLFNDLTVQDHLEMFCVFKSVNDSIKEKEILKVINDFGLKEKRYTKAMHLSGGQKRKLSIAMALVGGSSVIFLDEPTSGMDIFSRRKLWNELKKYLNGKIIILTTHYMEEASVLGNRIGILSEGELQCIGSPLFLIEKLGKTINLNVCKNNTNSDNNIIIDFIKNNSGYNLDIEYEIFNEEICFKIPKEDNKFKGKEFFIKLDENLQNLNIKSYSISMSTLEDVFINISKIVKRKKMTKEEYDKEELKKKKIIEKNKKILYDNNNYNMKYSYCSKFIRDIKISMKKRSFQILREKKAFILEVLSPILLILIGCIVAWMDILIKNNILPLKMSQLTNNSQIIYYSSTTGDNIADKIFLDYTSENISNVEFKYINFETENNVTKDSVTFMQKIYDIKSNDISNKAENYVAYLITKIDNEFNQYEFTYFPDISQKHTTPIYSNYLLKNLIRYATDNKDLEIKIAIEPFPYTYVEKKDELQRNNIKIIFFISLSFSLIPSNFITIIIKERENNSKYLQIISGISLFSYWVNNYIFELVKYYVIGGIGLFFIYLVDYYKKYLFILYLEYGPAMVSFTYLFSFIFKSEEKAQTAVLLINLLVGALGGCSILIMRMNETLYKKARTLSYIFKIIPSFCFCYGYNVLLNEENLKNENILDFEFLKGDFIYLGTESALYLLILIFFENSNKLFIFCYTSSEKSNHNKIKKEIKNNQNDEKFNKVSIPENVNDSHVKNEIAKALNSNSQEKYAIRIQNLIKTFYGGPCGFKIFSHCFKSTKAIRNISFCLDFGECFGFLGINGAGKTTTFKCLSNEIFPTSGNIIINDKNINKDFESIRNLIGYCPQFDAIFEFMSVYENLEFYGLVKGAKIEKIKEIVNALIEDMNLLPYKNKLAGQLSGGNKRKLSVAIALICNPSILLLDEPSNGMDPEARRFLWGVIHRISLNQKKSTIIMTTHSMEEAETLCKRIGILVDGQFKCFSTSNEIKEKYGYGYEINFQINKPDINILYEMNNVCEEDKSKDIHDYCLEKCLELYHLDKYCLLMKKDSLGGKILEEIEIYRKISFNKILYWVFYLNNFFKIVKVILDLFPEVYCYDYSDNNFFISIKKESGKSIGQLYGLIEDNRKNYNIEQYDLKLTSLEQIFNKFAREKENNYNQKMKNENMINLKITKELINYYIRK